ncbi:hypothetical protein ACWGOK_41735, partial [Streptomyces eurythermus]
MSERLHFILDGDDRLSRVLNGAGDSSDRLHRRLSRDMDGNSRAVTQFARTSDSSLRDVRGDLRGVGDAATHTNNQIHGLWRDSDGRLRDLRGRFAAARQGAETLSGVLPDVAKGMSSTAASGGSLSGVLMGVAAAAGLSLLPALGAVVPMAAGLGVAFGTIKMGFSGVGDAMAASAQGGKEYKKALKELSPEQREFTKALVSAKKEFAPVGKEVRKAMLPAFTQAVKDASPVVKILGKSMTEMGGAFGEAARGVGRMMKDSGFQKDLQANLHLGVGFVKEMTTSMGPFTRSLLDFGAASGPTLKSFSSGIGGLLSKGLPSMFDGLKQGIPGASKMLDGLFSLVNDLLGGLGKLGGAAAKALGPLFGDTLKDSGSILSGLLDAAATGLVKLEPLFRDLGFGLKTIMDIGSILGPTLGDTGAAIAGAFLPIGDSVEKGVGPLQRLRQAVQDNKGAILELGRWFGD